MIETSADGSDSEQGSITHTGDESAISRWILLDGNRWLLALGLSALTFVGFVTLGVADVIGVTKSSLVTGIFTASITGLFTLITITTSINQLVLSRVFGSPEDIAERIDSVREFRKHVEELHPQAEVSPTAPAAFLSLLVQAAIVDTDRIKSAFERSDETIPDQLDELTTVMIDLFDEVDRQLDGENLTLYETLSPILDDEYSNYLHTVRRIQATTSNLDDEQSDALDDLETVLLAINRTRHYFKTLYLHEELAEVSRLVLVSGVPALFVSYVTILSYNTPPSEGLLPLVLVSGVMVVALFPLLILFVYLIRIATIARRTTTFGSFTPVNEMP